MTAGHTLAASEAERRVTILRRRRGGCAGESKRRPDPSPVLGIKVVAELLANMPATPWFLPGGHSRCLSPWLAKERGH